MLKEIRIALSLFMLLTLITGIAYPAIVTVVAQFLFARQANGSLVIQDGKAAGSELLGQAFSAPQYFWGRPSATSPQPDNGAMSSGSNLAVTNPKHGERVSARLGALHAAQPGNPALVPVDLVTASASGLDPHISPAAAEYQVARVARARSLPEALVRSLVARSTEGRTFGILGEPRVNVLELNLSLDAQPH